VENVDRDGAKGKESEYKKLPSQTNKHLKTILWDFTTWNLVSSGISTAK
jgi:hypothetical protein